MITRSLLVRLSSFRDDDASLTAAREVLDAPDREATLDRLYAAALPQRILPTVLAHLERAGADHDVLTVSAPLFRSLWPLNALLPPPEDRAADRVKLSWIRRQVDTHRELLRRAVAEMPAVRSARAMAVFGLAYEVAYPAYRHREHNDADVYAADAATAVAMAEDLLRRRGFVLLRFRTSRGDRGTLAHFKLMGATDDGHQLHVDVIGGGRPTGPGLRPPIVYPPLLERARRVQTDGAAGLVPAASDMLLLQAEKVQRRGAFTLRDFNDTQFLLAAEEGRIDWDSLVGAARRYGIGGALHRLVMEAERRESRELAPGVLEALAPGRKQRRLIDALDGPESAASHPGRAATTAARQWRRSWFREAVRSRLTHPGALIRLLAEVAHGGLVKLQLRMAHRAMGRRLRRVGVRGPVVLGALPNPKAAPRTGVDEEG